MEVKEIQPTSQESTNILKKMDLYLVIAVMFAKKIIQELIMILLYLNYMIINSSFVTPMFIDIIDR